MRRTAGRAERVVVAAGVCSLAGGLLAVLAGACSDPFSSEGYVGGDGGTIVGGNDATTGSSDGGSVNDLPSDGITDTTCMVRSCTAMGVECGTTLDGCNRTARVRGVPPLRRHVRRQQVHLHPEVRGRGRLQGAERQHAVRPRARRLRRPLRLPRLRQQHLPERQHLRQRSRACRAASPTAPAAPSATAAAPTTPAFPTARPIRPAPAAAAAPIRTSAGARRRAAGSRASPAAPAPSTTSAAARWTAAAASSRRASAATDKLCKTCTRVSHILGYDDQCMTGAHPFAWACDCIDGGACVVPDGLKAPIPTCKQLLNTDLHAVYCCDETN